MSESTGFPDLSTIFAKVAENPQAMGMLSSLLGGASADTKVVSTKAEEEESEEKATDAQAANGETPVFAPQKPKGKGRRHEDKRRLLLALKPFLSKERQEALKTLLLVLEAIALLSPGKEPPCT